MQILSIQLKESQGFERKLEPVSFSIPFAKGELLSVAQLQLCHAKQPLTSQFVTLSSWPDGSIRWLQANTLMSIAANSETALQLHKLPVAQTVSNNTDGLTESATEWQLTGSTSQLKIDKQTLQLQCTAANQTWHGQFELADLYGKATSFIPNLPSAQWQMGKVYSELSIKGLWQLTDRQLHSELRLRFWYEAARLDIEASLHNADRAAHPGGLWDLGDAGSILFNHFNFTLQSEADGEHSLQLTPSDDAQLFSKEQYTILFQASSGGEQWQSLNHVNCDGQVFLPFQGFQLTANSSLIAEGFRAQPQATLITNAQPCQLAQRNFWQNFPGSITQTNKRITLGLFPAEANTPFELQGGEQKTHHFALTFGQASGSLCDIHAPIQAVVAPSYYQSAQALPWFAPMHAEDPIQPLFADALDGPANFFAKREVIDEFGWRNFGDIFADHESLYLREHEAPYISHYNNQYDAIYGFARQFALTGDQRWRQLMDDLARHVTDIDIYHTNNDRVEYNNGLFWHTDHYLPVHTATHRTYSKHNQTSSIPGQTGGGPAAEHCYTTGLKYHYWLTGNSHSKAAVIQLTDWMQALHGEAPGLLNQLWAIKSRELPALISSFKGKQRPLYPFTRGTGNYITALLDAYDLTLNKHYLQLSAKVIKQTISAHDAIAARNLLDAEVAWSYVIMLSAVARFLQQKNLLGEFDDDFTYAKASFLAYCRWMQQHEQLYLTAAAELEFPNDTWLAQDIRKVMLMFQAAELSPTEANIFISKATSWLNAICQGLATSPERHFARVQIILLQNFGPHYANELYAKEALQPATLPRQTRYLILLLLGKIGYKVIKGLLSFRPNREKNWLKTRIKG
ncbi:RIFT barrel domain-containing protein [Alishewanella sp. HL-SH06]|uniref:RIFT barrel domain-containing protein n=1 Tax=Alishewanella sp. HL-SH06 TaxID=3461144 RepID=UPI004041DA82